MSIRDEVITELRKRQIGVSVHFIPVCSFSLMKERYGFDEIGLTDGALCFLGVIPEIRVCHFFVILCELLMQGRDVKDTS